MRKTFAKVCLRCGKDFVAYSAKAQRCLKCAEIHYREHIAYLHSLRYQEREITCEDCGETFRSAGRKRYCPECLKTRKVAAVHKCHKIRYGDTDYLKRLIGQICAGAIKEDCAQCPAICSRRILDYEMHGNSGKRVSC